MQDIEGETVDLDGFSNDIDEPETAYGLSADAKSGTVSTAALNETLATVCQVPSGEEPKKPLPKIDMVEVSCKVLAFTSTRNLQLLHDPEIVERNPALSYTFRK